MPISNVEAMINYSGTLLSFDDNVFIFDPIDDFFGNYQECARHVRTYSASSPFASP